MFNSRCLFVIIVCTACCLRIVSMHDIRYHPCLKLTRLQRRDNITCMSYRDIRERKLVPAWCRPCFPSGEKPIPTHFGGTRPTHNRSHIGPDRRHCMPR